MKRLISLSVIDQAMLSAVSLAISLFLIKFATPQSLGSFAVATAMTFLATAVQNALVTTPVAVRTHGIDAGARQAVLATLSSVDLVLNVALTLASFLAGVAMGFTVLQAIAAALFLGSSLIRELARSIYFADEHIGKCMKLDALFVLTGAIFMIALWQFVTPDIACLLGLAGGNLLASWWFAPVFHRQFGNLASHVKAYAAYWTDGRWMLMGAAASELQDRSYVFMLQSLRGVSTVGTIHAGRFLIAPLGLLTTAWGRATRPRMAALLREGKHAEARRILYSGLAIISGLTLAYIVVLVALWHVIEQQLFNGRYENMWPVVLAWCGYGLLSVPVNCFSFYFQAEKRFMAMAYNTVWASLGTLLSLICLVWPVPDLSAIFCLYIGLVIALAAQITWWLSKPLAVETPA